MRRGHVALCTLLVVVGCRKSYPTIEEMKERQRAELAPVAEKHRARAMPILAALRKADADALAAEPVMSDEPMAQNLVVGKASPSKDELEDAGILLETPGQLTRKPGFVKVHLWPTLGVNKIGDLLETGLYDASTTAAPAQVDAEIGKLETVHHLIVLRVRGYTAPEPQGKTFTPGHAYGDVLVYSIPDATRVGSFRIDVTQRAAELTVREAGTKKEDLALAFKSELERAAIAIVLGNGGPVEAAP